MSSNSGRSAARLSISTTVFVPARSPQAARVELGAQARG